MALEVLSQLPTSRVVTVHLGHLRAVISREARHEAKIRKVLEETGGSLLMQDLQRKLSGLSHPPSCGKCYMPGEHRASRRVFPAGREAEVCALVVISPYYVNRVNCQPGRFFKASRVSTDC